MNNALKLRSFYPKGHNAVAPPLARFGTLLDSALNDMGEIIIGSTGDKLLFQGRSFGEGKRALRAFAKHLKMRNLTGIIFRPGVTEEEVENLLEILSMDSEDTAPADSPLQHTESSMSNIELRRIDYGSVLRHISDDEALSRLDHPGDIWKDLVTYDLLSDGDELSDEARELIAGSCGDKAALEEMTSQLVRMCSDSAGDPNAEVARGLAKTCKGMEGLEGTRLEHGMSNLAEIVAKMDPEIVARLAETEVTHSSTGDDLIQKMMEKLPPKAKLRLLSALVDSQQLNKSRLSSVFRRVAGARSRRRELLEELENSPGNSVERPVRVTIDRSMRTFMVHVTALKDDKNRYMGMVVVFDDLTEIEKAQRMAAWREVARRIAHEVKNPLTPIKLSAQRLRRKYGDQIVTDNPVFMECTQTIIDQADQIRNLVNEFSSFARLPASNPEPCQLPEIIEEAVALYREARPEIFFQIDSEPDIPQLNLDRQQMKRVMINLIDNAIAAMNGKGAIGVALSFDPILRIVRLEVSDTGIGISPEDKIRLFEPYFSTKRTGMGLGLSIVSAIIEDHNGFIRVQDNKPRGTKFIVELPA